MPERNLGPGLRMLLGLLGAVAVGAGGVVGAREIRIASKFWPYWPSVAVAAFCSVVVLGGLLLLRGAVSGHIMVRRTRRPGSAR
jgi:hypothetical protein